MAKTFSKMMELGTVAPDFELQDVISKQKKSLDDLASEVATVIMFICNHCPFVIHVQKELVRLASDYLPKGVSFVAINSNDISEYPQDSPEKMQETAKNLKYPFPYLYDETQEVARAYDAACTPDFFVFDKNRRCVYRGRIDESTPGNAVPVTGQDLRKALDAIIAGTPVNAKQYPSVGCNIKWKTS
ncbi:MAG: thioredoxin family protein [Deltaproteobacteria bacterium]|nr:thioredoxin family protein [Deltaproteobacteria bacterium]